MKHHMLREAKDVNPPADMSQQQRRPCYDWAAVERHEVGSGAIYTLRRQAMSGALSGVPARPQTAFAAVRISEPPVML